MSAHDGLPNTQFGDVVFPVSSRTIHGQGRKHIHEYPHSPGGAPEKLGRGLWNITLSAMFHNTFARYPGLYPQALNTLRGYFESQVTKTYVDPTIGSFPAFIVDFKQVKVSRVRSGETAEIELLEDQQTAFLIADFSKQAQLNVLTVAQRLPPALQSIKAQLQVRSGDQAIFDAIRNTANSVFAIRDTAGLYGNLLAAKVDQMTQLCAQADSLLFMKDPRAWPLVDALHELWATSVKLQNDLQSRLVQLQTWNVVQTMTIQDVARAIYGDSSKVSDLLALNGPRIPDPLRVPAATAIRYYPAA